MLFSRRACVRCGFLPRRASWPPLALALGFRPPARRVLGLPFGRAAALRRPVARLLRHAQRLRPLEAQRRWLGGGGAERLLRGQRVQHP